MPAVTTAAIAPAGAAALRHKTEQHPKTKEPRFRAALITPTVAIAFTVNRLDVLDQGSRQLMLALQSRITWRKFCRILNQNSQMK
jgi:hypothetical protein